MYHMLKTLPSFVSLTWDMVSLFRDTGVEVAEFSNLYREQGTAKRLAGTGEREGGSQHFKQHKQYPCFWISHLFLICFEKAE